MGKCIEIAQSIRPINQSENRKNGLFSGLWAKVKSGKSHNECILQVWSQPIKRFVRKCTERTEGLADKAIPMSPSNCLVRDNVLVSRNQICASLMVQCAKSVTNIYKGPIGSIKQLHVEANTHLDMQISHADKGKCTSSLNIISAWWPRVQ